MTPVSLTSSDLSNTKLAPLGRAKLLTRRVWRSTKFPWRRD